MTDNELIAAVRAIMLPLMPGVAVKASYQPQQRGPDTGPTIYMHKIGDARYGHPSRVPVWNGTDMIDTDAQQYETTIQFTALARQDVADTSLPTASDLANQACAILQSDATIAALAAQGVGLLRVQDVRNPYFTDDEGRFEASPSFDVVFRHTRIYTAAGAVISTFETGIHRV